MPEKLPETKRAYPVFYERMIPIAIGALVIIVLVTLVFTILVGVGLLEFG